MPNTLFNIPGQNRITRSAIWPQTASDGGYLLAWLFFDAPVLIAFTAGVAAGTSTSSAAVQGAGVVAGSCAGLSDAAANVQGAGVIAGSADGQSAASASVVGYAQISGTASGQSDAAAALEGMGVISGDVAGNSSASAVISFTVDNTEIAAPETVLLDSAVQIVYRGRSITRQSTTLALDSAVQVEFVSACADIQTEIVKQSPVKTLFTGKSLIL